MPRQRLNLHRPTLALLGTVLVVVLAAALIFYGGILLLLSVKAFSPSTLDGVSGYRRVYDELAGLQQNDLGDTLRLIAGALGLLAFLLFAYLAIKQIPRPHLARHDLDLSEDERGTVTVAPRAIERVAETAALRHHSIADATGRYGTEQLTVDVAVRHAATVPETLRETQQQVADALEQHGLPATKVQIILTGYERQTRRELS